MKSATTMTAKPAEYSDMTKLNMNGRTVSSGGRSLHSREESYHETKTTSCLVEGVRPKRWETTGATEQHRTSNALANHHRAGPLSTNHQAPSRTMRRYVGHDVIRQREAIADDMWDLSWNDGRFAKIRVHVFFICFTSRKRKTFLAVEACLATSFVTYTVADTAWKSSPPGPQATFGQMVRALAPESVIPGFVLQ